MTKGDKIKLRAELAGKAMQGMVSNDYYTNGSSKEEIACWAVDQADALMAELGISMDSEWDRVMCEKSMEEDDE